MRKILHNQDSLELYDIIKMFKLIYYDEKILFILKRYLTGIGTKKLSLENTLSILKREIYLCCNLYSNEFMKIKLKNNINLIFDASFDDFDNLNNKNSFT
jgi:hypothetical protein